MEKEDIIINRVISSALITLDLKDFYHPGERIIYDLKDNLFQQLILKENDFREFIKNNDWSLYKDKNVAIMCSADAIIPTWAYILLSIKLEPFAHKVVYGNLEALEQSLFQEALSKINPEDYRDSKVVIKGCSDLPVPVFAYVELARLLRPYVSSLMYGEPCSTVPLYKRK